MRRTVLADLRMLSRGSPIPSISLLDINSKSRAGLDSLMKCPTLASFVDPRCESCIEAVVAFDSAVSWPSTAWAPSGFVILGDTSESGTFVGSARAMGAKIPMYADVDKVLSNECGLIVFPTLLISDSAGLLLDALSTGYSRDEYDSALVMCSQNL